MNGLIGRKLGMTRLFDEEGTAVPVTVIAAGPCPVVQVTGDRVQLGFEQRKATRTPKALLGHAKKAGLEAAPRVLRSFFIVGDAAPKPGEAVTVTIFQAGETVKVTGVTQGRGLQSGGHRPHLRGRPQTHRNPRPPQPGPDP